MKRFLILLIAVFLFSCGGVGQDIEQERVGKQGVVVEFIKDAPPEQIYENIPTTLGFTIQNQGFADITGVKLVINDQGRFLPFSYVHFADLPGKTFSEPITEVFPQFITITPRELFTLGEQEVTISISACYPYETKLSHAVCIDTDPLEDDNDARECRRTGKEKIRKDKLSRGQGAPVAVTEFTSQMIPTVTGVIPQFSFVVENVGKGRVMSTAAVAKACSAQGLHLNEIGAVDTSNIKLGLEVLSCNKARLRIEEIGDEKLEKELARVTCQGQEISRDKPPYLGHISLTLTYGYQETVEKEIEVTERKV